MTCFGVSEGKTIASVLQILPNKQQILGGVYIHWHFSSSTDTVVLSEWMMNNTLLNFNKGTLAQTMNQRQNYQRFRWKPRPIWYEISIEQNILTLLTFWGLKYAVELKKNRLQAGSITPIRPKRYFDTKKTHFFAVGSVDAEINVSERAAADLSYQTICRLRRIANHKFLLFPRSFCRHVHFVNASTITLLCSLSTTLVMSVRLQTTTCRVHSVRKYRKIFPIFK